MNHITISTNCVSSMILRKLLLFRRNLAKINYSNERRHHSRGILVLILYRETYLLIN